MKKSSFNFVIDILMFLVMSGIIGIGFLIKYSLIPGQQRWEKYGTNVDLRFLNLDRHQWGDIHLVLGLILAALLILHILFHRKTILCLYRRLFNTLKYKKLFLFFFIVICVMLIAFPFLFKPKIIPAKRGEGRMITHSELLNNNESGINYQLKNNEI